MGTWIIWLIVAAVLGTIEIATTTLAFGLVGLAALVAAGAGFAGGGGAIQFGAFVLTSAVGLGVGVEIGGAEGADFRPRITCRFAGVASHRPTCGRIGLPEKPRVRS